MFSNEVSALQPDLLLCRSTGTIAGDRGASRLVPDQALPDAGHVDEEAQHHQLLDAALVLQQDVDADLDAADAHREEQVGVVLAQVGVDEAVLVELEAAPRDGRSDGVGEDGLEETLGVDALGEGVLDEAVVGVRGEVGLVALLLRHAGTIARRGRFDKLFARRLDSGRNGPRCSNACRDVRETRCARIRQPATSADAATPGGLRGGLGADGWGRPKSLGLPTRLRCSPVDSGAQGTACCACERQRIRENAPMDVDVGASERTRPGCRTARRSSQRVSEFSGARLRNRRRDRARSSRFTVHDDTHLDALWEMADIIAGTPFVLTPSEAFVLGGAFLIHDLGMGVAAYPEGIGALRGHKTWLDTISSLLRRQLGRAPNPDEIANPPQDVEKEAVRGTLRQLHAEHAAVLALIPWRTPTSQTEYHLIEDPELRNYFGETIGRIAHSHWWSVSELSDNFKAEITAPGGWPNAWTVDPLKVACLLRVADAAHIDARRAPQLPYGRCADLLVSQMTTGASRRSCISRASQTIALPTHLEPLFLLKMRPHGGFVAIRLP